MSLDWVQGKGLSVDRDHYQMVYAMQREPGETLEDIYRRFNIDHPEDFKGHSLSVSDVVVLHEKGTDTAYYVDSIGFKELPDFFGAGTPEAKRDVSVREQLACAACFLALSSCSRTETSRFASGVPAPKKSGSSLNPMLST